MKTHAPSLGKTVIYKRPAEITPDPLQPRREFDAAKLKSLAANIKARGILHPIHCIQIGKRLPLPASIDGLENSIAHKKDCDALDGYGCNCGAAAKARRAKAAKSTEEASDGK